MSNQEHKFHKGDEPHELYEPLEGDQRLRQNGPHLFSIQHGPIIRFSHIEEQEELLPPRLELQGSQRLQGLQRPQRSQGPQGFQRPQRSQGFQGLQGPQRLQGLQNLQPQAPLRNIGFRKIFYLFLILYFLDAAQSCLNNAGNLYPSLYKKTFYWFFFWIHSLFKIIVEGIRLYEMGAYLYLKYTLFFEAIFNDRDLIDRLRLKILNP